MQKIAIYRKDEKGMMYCAGRDLTPEEAGKQADEYYRETGRSTFMCIQEESAMSKFYLRENTGAILNEKEYDNVPHHNPQTDNYIALGEFKDKSEAKRYYHQTYLPSVEKSGTEDTQ